LYTSRQKLLEKNEKSKSQKRSVAEWLQCNGESDKMSKDKNCHKCSVETINVSTIIGGRSYWAGQAMARPLLGPYRLRLSLARPLLSPV